MAKKAVAKQKSIPNYKKIAEEIAKRRKAQQCFKTVERHKIPKATLFVNGQKIILNDDNGGRE